ncbi:MAG: HD domain-containing phosphohydrolase [Armatimonadota bacterium]
MDKRRRSEKLITILRWLVMTVGLASVADYLPTNQIIMLVGLVVVYNAVMTWTVSDLQRFSNYGRLTSIITRGLDIAVISAVLIPHSATHSQAHLLYLFVLVSLGFTITNTQRMYVGCGVVAFSALFVSILSLSNNAFTPDGLKIISLRIAALAFGFAVTLFISKTRSQDELASERGSYINAILNCGAKLTSFRDVHELSMFVLESAIKETNAAGGQLLLYNEEKNNLECEAFFTMDNSDAIMPQESKIQSYINWVLGSGREIMIQAGGRHSEDDEGEKSQQAIIAVPMLWHDKNKDNPNQVVGILMLWGYPNEDFGPDAMDIARIFAAMADAAIINLKLFTNLQKSFVSTLQSLANGLEARDEYTRGHSERVMTVACMIAEEIGVEQESIDLLRNAALLHDIGKIGVPDNVLRKAGKLTSEEWEAMRKHPVVSAEICEPLGLHPDVLFLIKHHQEKLDGKGYPSGLSAEEQPLLLRILVVADAFDAMRSRRPYRDRMPQDELEAELNRCAGRTMDPTVVDALKKLMNRGEMDSVYASHDKAIEGISFHIESSDEQAAA